MDLKHFPEINQFSLTTDSPKDLSLCGFTLSTLPRVTQLWLRNPELSCLSCAGVFFQSQKDDKQ